MKKPNTYRSTENVDLKIKELIERFPDAYKNRSEVIRAGVIQLHKQRIDNKNKFFGGIFKNGNK